MHWCVHAPLAQSIFPSLGRILYEIMIAMLSLKVAFVPYTSCHYCQLPRVWCSVCWLVGWSIRWQQKHQRCWRHTTVASFRQCLPRVWATSHWQQSLVSDSVCLEYGALPHFTAAVECLTLCEAWPSPTQHQLLWVERMVICYQLELGK